MESNISNIEAYWNKRYSEEGMIWGRIPSRTAEYALDLFGKNGIKTILVPGSGYGRNTRAFSTAGFTVTGVEISEFAYELSKHYDPLTTFHKASAFDMPVPDAGFDALYCFNVLHLFRRDDRMLFIESCMSKLAENGVAFFSAFTETESSFGMGTEVEDNTFESKPGRPVHYFTESDMLGHFSKYELVEIGIIEDFEDHGGDPHTHQLRYILVKKQC